MPAFLMNCAYATSIFNSDVENLIATLKAPTPIISDLKQLTDEIGGRLTGTQANKKSVNWALKKFHEAGVTAKKESFTMPRAWSEKSSSAKVFNSQINFSPRIVAMPFTKKTHYRGLSAKIVNLNKGSATDFQKMNVDDDLKDKWLLIETDILNDERGIAGLFQEYNNAVIIEEQALAVAATGIIYMSSRPKNLLYRHLPSSGVDNKLAIVVMERESALRTQRLINSGQSLKFTAKINILGEKPYQANNVVAEIKGDTYPDEIVLIGAHIDSFDLGTGALDNGANVSLVIDLARQITKLAITPKRTIRFVLFNGEEQGMYGSWGYTQTHIDELDNHVLAATIDIGTGAITGFFINGREEIKATIDSVLHPDVELGAFNQIIDPVVGTDNYDFMMQGIANLVANQADANYASNYHAQSDTFEKVDQQQLKLNAAIMGATILGIANLDEIPWQRQTAEQVVKMVEQYKLEQAMKTFGLQQSWQENKRGIQH
ncbi:M28 family peptidase [Colwellia hornerae]|uniref:Carboxypeptidase Q n=2 Tax=Colwellia hornerae TaxID=89402 RepID=A0A5C6QSJ5_9GAMM|nr:M28 family peptidase [Colwellia hornerae]TWX62685.1 M28 family peptidase [Colwellia hornerae]TWX71590.1 M28 family peptidase [Colwellia hornerae]